MSLVGLGGVGPVAGVGRNGVGLAVLNVECGTYGIEAVVCGNGSTMGVGGGVGLGGSRVGLWVGCGPHLSSEALLQGYLGHFTSGSKSRLSGHENFIAENC